MPNPKTEAHPKALAAFLVRCRKLAERTDRTLGAVSFSIFNDGSRITEIEAGGDIGVRRLARAEAKLADLERQPHPEAAKAKAKTRR